MAEPQKKSLSSTTDNWGPEVGATDGPGSSIGADIKQGQSQSAFDSWGPEVGAGTSVNAAASDAPPGIGVPLHDPNKDFEPEKSFTEKVTGGLISPDSVSKAMTGLAGGQQQLADERDALRPDETPAQAGFHAATAGMLHDTADLGSAVTSPLSIATMGLSAAAKVPGVIAKVARPALTALSLGFGVKGAHDIAEGASKGLATPEGAQEALMGASQVVGAVPEVPNAVRGAKVMAGHVVPTAFASGEEALLKGLQPTKKDTPFLRRAIAKVGPELNKFNGESIEDFRDYASNKREAVAKELERRLSLTQGTTPPIDANAVRARVMREINPLMQLEGKTSTSMQLTPQNQNAPAPVTTTKLSPQAKAIQDYAQTVSDNLAQNPISLTQAEGLVQYINSRTTEFERMTPDAKRQAIAEGDPIIAQKALKLALQNQIEAHLSNYKDLKGQYGSWKEIQNRTEDQMNNLDRKPSVSWLSRHGAEALGAGLGTILGGSHAMPYAGGVSGYLLGKGLTDTFLEHRSSPESLITRGAATTGIPSAGYQHPGALSPLQAISAASEENFDHRKVPSLIQSFTQPSQGDRVRVRHPDGTTGTIPRADLKSALEQGYGLAY